MSKEVKRKNNSKIIALLSVLGIAPLPPSVARVVVKRISLTNSKIILHRLRVFTYLYVEENSRALSHTDCCHLLIYLSLSFLNLFVQLVHLCVWELSLNSFPFHLSDGTKHTLANLQITTSRVHFILTCILR